MLALTGEEVEMIYTAGLPVAVKVVATGVPPVSAVYKRTPLPEVTPLASTRKVAFDVPQSELEGGTVIDVDAIAVNA